MDITRTLGAALLLAPVLAAAAEPVTIGNWMVGLSNDRESSYAGNVNDSGSVLMETCSTSKDSCLWIVTLDSECKEGNTYPVLMNSEEGAAASSVTCMGESASGSTYRYLFTDWKTLEGVILKGKRVGFAFPMQADQFTVVRFALEGIGEAAPAAEQLAAATRKAMSGSTRNTRL